jgi:hypothetical protein
VITAAEGTGIAQMVAAAIAAAEGRDDGDLIDAVREQTAWHAIAHDQRKEQLKATDLWGRRSDRQAKTTFTLNDPGGTC